MRGVIFVAAKYSGTVGVVTSGMVSAVNGLAKLIVQGGGDPQFLTSTAKGLVKGEGEGGDLKGEGMRASLSRDARCCTSAKRKEAVGTGRWRSLRGREETAHLSPQLTPCD